MAFAKMAAHELLGAPWLAHLGLYKRLNSIGPQSSSSAADLIGERITTGEYVVAEAKGRNKSLYKEALDKAVEQAKGNSYIIDGTRCGLCVGSVLYRQRRCNRLAIVWKDPEPSSKSVQHHLEVDKEFWREYCSIPWDLWELQRKDPDRMAVRLGHRLDAVADGVVIDVLRREAPSRCLAMRP